MWKLYGEFAQAYKPSETLELHNPTGSSRAEASLPGFLLRLGERLQTPSHTQGIRKLVKTCESQVKWWQMITSSIQYLELFFQVLIEL